MSNNAVKQMESGLVITEEERLELTRMLEESLADTRVELHHTHTPGFREEVLHRKELLRSLLAKIQKGK